MRARYSIIGVEDLRFLGIGFLVLALAVTLTACRKEEQGRKLQYEKGTYLGQADTPLSAEEKSELRLRATSQRGP